MLRLPLRLMPIFIAAAIASAQAPPPNAWSPRLLPVDTPAGADSGQPQLSTSDAGVLLSWIERSGKTAVLKFARRTAAGWSTPQVVASGEDWFVNWADVPSVLRLENGELVAHWLQKSGPGTYAYDVRLAYSKDDGRTWSPSFTPHSDGTQTEHGFASLFQMPGAGLGLIWLDGRAMTGSSHGSHGGGGSMSVRFAVFGRDWKQREETLVDARVCECCPTAAAVTADGPVVAYRDRTDEEVRDIHLSRLEKGVWTASRAVHDDGWKIPACPVNGPMLSARGRDVAIAWFTMRGDEPQAFVAFSSDAGRSFGRPIRLDEAGSQGRVDVELLPDGSAVASWIEVAGERAQFRVRQVYPSGARSPALTIAALSSSRASGYPRIALNATELVFAWTEVGNGRTIVRTATAPAPVR